MIKDEIARIKNWERLNLPPMDIFNLPWVFCEDDVLAAYEETRARLKNELDQDTIDILTHAKNFILYVCFSGAEPTADNPFYKASNKSDNRSFDNLLVQLIKKSRASKTKSLDIEQLINQIKSAINENPALINYQLGSPTFKTIGYLAAELNQPDLFKFLLDKGLDPLVKMPFGLNPLEAAFFKRHTDIITLYKQSVPEEKFKKYLSDLLLNHRHVCILNPAYSYAKENKIEIPDQNTLISQNFYSLPAAYQDQSDDFIKDHIKAQIITKLLLNHELPKIKPIPNKYIDPYFIKALCQLDKNARSGLGVPSDDLTLNYSIYLGIAVCHIFPIVAGILLIPITTGFPAILALMAVIVATMAVISLMLDGLVIYGKVREHQEKNKINKAMKNPVAEMGIFKTKKTMENLVEHIPLMDLNPSNATVKHSM